MEHESYNNIFNDTHTDRYPAQTYSHIMSLPAAAKPEASGMCSPWAYLAGRASHILSTPIGPWNSHLLLGLVGFLGAFLRFSHWKQRLLTEQSLWLHGQPLVRCNMEDHLCDPTHLTHPTPMALQVTSSIAEVPTLVQRSTNKVCN